VRRFAAEAETLNLAKTVGRAIFEKFLIKQNRFWIISLAQMISSEILQNKNQ